MCFDRLINWLLFGWGSLRLQYRLLQYVRRMWPLWPVTNANKKFVFVIIKMYTNVANFKLHLFYTYVAFNTVGRWRELGEVENNCTLHTFILHAISVPKIIKVGGNLTTLWQKQFGTVFLDTMCIHDCYSNNKKYVRQWPHIVRPSDSHNSI